MEARTKGLLVLSILAIHLPLSVSRLAQELETFCKALEHPQPLLHKIGSGLRMYDKPLQVSVAKFSMLAKIGDALSDLLVVYGLQDGIIARDGAVIFCVEDTIMLCPMIQCMYTLNPTATWNDLNEGITRARKILGIVANHVDAVAAPVTPLYRLQ